MKRFSVLIAAIVVLLGTAQSQDIIIKKNGDEIKAKIIEISDVAVKFKKWENVDGPLYNINPTDIFKIKYENGQSEMFNSATEIKPVTSEPAKPAVLTLSKTATTKGYPTPEVVNVPYFFDSERNTLLELETVSYTSEKVRSGAWGRHNIIVLPGSSSTIHFSKKQAPKFLIRFDKLEGQQPYTACLLNTCEVNDKLKRREWVASTTGMHGKEAQHDEVQISFQSVGNGLYLITLDKKLKTGELFFMPSGSYLVYAFSYLK
jgi:hypothetical protein